MPKVGDGRAVVVRGLNDFQRDLRRANAQLPRELRRGLKDAAEVVADEARRQAVSEGGVIAKAGPSIKAAAEQRAAKLTWGGARFPFANGAFFGAIRYPQFRPWVGNTWEVGDPNEGPYVINEAIDRTTDPLLDAIGDVIEDLYGRAFPIPV